MSILPRYFLRLFLPIFLLCFAVFTGVLLMNNFLRLFNLAVMKGISPLWIAMCFARLLPFISSLALPMAYVVALLLTLGQLSESGEVMALRASGFSYGEMVWPFMAVAVILSGLLLYLDHKASPDGFHAFRNQYELAARQIARVDMEPNSFAQIGPWRLFAKTVDKDSGRLGEVYLVRAGGASQGIRVSAAHGRLELERGKGVTLELEDGNLQMSNPDPEKFTSGSFKKYRVDVPLSGGVLRGRAPDIPEISSRRLKELARDPRTTPQHKNEYAVELAVRSASAFSPFVFFWIGAPLGLELSRRSRGAGFALSLGILFIFYGFMALGIGIGRRHESLAGAAPWMADALGMALGLYLTRKAAAK